MLILVRHGQTEPNARGVLLGRADPPLTDLGRRQAAALAAVLPPGRVICSPLGRASETAAALGRPVQVDERWIEMDYGAYEGRAPGEVPAAVWDRWLADPGFAPPGGETLAAVAARVAAACRDLAVEAAGADVVVVSHVSPIKAAVAWALGGPATLVWRMFLDVAGVSRIGFGPRGPVLRTFNEGARLAPW